MVEEKRKKAAEKGKKETKKKEEKKAETRAKEKKEAEAVEEEKQEATVAPEKGEAKSENQKKFEEEKTIPAEEKAESEKKTPEAKEEQAEESGGKDTYFLIAAAALVMCFALFFAVQHFYKPAPKYEIVTYHGFKFVKMSGLWYFNWQKGEQMYTPSLHYTPYEVEAVPIYGEVDERFQQQRIYITHDPAEYGLAYVALATAEITSNLITTQNVMIEAACSKNETADCWTRPIITCENTNSSVIYLKEADEARVDLKGNCIVIQGKGPELIKAAEKVLYIWYNII